MAVAVHAHAVPGAQVRRLGRQRLQQRRVRGAHRGAVRAGLVRPRGIAVVLADVLGFNRQRGHVVQPAIEVGACRDKVSFLS